MHNFLPNHPYLDHLPCKNFWDFFFIIQQQTNAHGGQIVCIQSFPFFKWLCRVLMKSSIALQLIHAHYTLNKLYFWMLIIWYKHKVGRCLGRTVCTNREEKIRIKSDDGFHFGFGNMCHCYWTRTTLSQTVKSLNWLWQLSLNQLLYSILEHVFVFYSTVLGWLWWQTVAVWTEWTAHHWRQGIKLKNPA